MLRFKVACCSGQGSEAGLPLPWPRTDDDMLMLCYGGFAPSFLPRGRVPEIELGAVGKTLGLKLCADRYAREKRPSSWAIISGSPPVRQAILDRWISQLKKSRRLDRRAVEQLLVLEYHLLRRTSLD